MQKISLENICTISGGTHSVNTLAEAELFCKSIAVGHYENFPIASILMPKQQRQDIFNIYAFARTADDIADTLLHLDSEDRIELLNDYINHLKFYCQNYISEIQNSPSGSNPILLALSHTIVKLQLDLGPFERLIEAFQMDSDFSQAQTWADLHNYCQYSANPVGELVLKVFGLHNSQTARLSDSICTALQLANFWQDFSVDLPNGRCFIPIDILKKHNLYGIDYTEWGEMDNLSNCLAEIFSYTENLFEIGKELLILLKPKRLKIELSATWHGGFLILSKTRMLGTDILLTRPIIRKSEMITILIKSLF